MEEESESPVDLTIMYNEFCLMYVDLITALYFYACTISLLEGRGCNICTGCITKIFTPPTAKLVIGMTKLYSTL